MKTNKTRSFIFFIFTFFFVTISVAQTSPNSVTNLKSSSFEINSSHKSFDNLTFDTGDMFVVLTEVKKDDAVKKNSISVYPNPFIDELTIMSDVLINSIEVYSIDGKLIYKKNSPEMTIDLNHLITGAYLLNINNETTFKIIKL